MVVCLEQGADLHMAQLMPLSLTISCFSKIQIGFTFLVPAHLGSPGKRAVKRVCVATKNRTALRQIPVNSYTFRGSWFHVTWVGAKLTGRRAKYPITVPKTTRADVGRPVFEVDRRSDADASVTWRRRRRRRRKLAAPSLPASDPTRTVHGLPVRPPARRGSTEAEVIRRSISRRSGQPIAVRSERSSDVARGLLTLHRRRHL